MFLPVFLAKKQTNKKNERKAAESTFISKQFQCHIFSFHVTDKNTHIHRVPPAEPRVSSCLVLIKPCGHMMHQNGKLASSLAPPCLEKTNSCFPTGGEREGEGEDGIWLKINELVPAGVSSHVYL